MTPARQPHAGQHASPRATTLLRPVISAAFIIALALLSSCREKSGASAFFDIVDCDTAIGPPPPPPQRASITFIMGSDDWAYNQYYTLAAHYYRMNPDSRTDRVVEGLTSLSQLLHYLRQNPTPDSMPYGLINIVTHGNEFIDLQMKLTPGGERTSAKAIAQALADGRFNASPGLPVDSATFIFLHGCAVGNNQELLDQLATLFGNSAKVMASRLFEYYAYLSPNRNPQSVEHYYARTWYAFYNPDSTYNEDAIVRQLRQRYPSDTTHWREGLRRRLQNDPTQLYHYSFTVPCNYVEYYENAAEIPSVNSRQQRQKWIAEHDDFTDLMNITGIPRHYFQIKFYKHKAADRQGNIYYGLRAKARSGVICLIQPLVEAENTLRPFRPHLDDTTYFAYSRKNNAER